MVPEPRARLPEAEGRSVALGSGDGRKLEVRENLDGEKGEGDRGEVDVE